MIVVNQSWGWVAKPQLPLHLIEVAGRTCYKSEAKITPESAEKFVASLLKSGHHSVIEHASASVRFITDRGVTHELVRHRLCAFSQESTRYCNYGGKPMQFIRPVWCFENVLGDWKEELPGKVNSDLIWLREMAKAEKCYNALLLLGWRPEQARSVLPNSLKTEIVVTANLREWRHIFSLRCSPKAHPQIRELMLSCLAGFQEVIPILFDDIKE